MRLFALTVFTLLSAAAAGRDAPVEPPDRVTHLGYNGDIRAMCRAGDSLWVGTSGGLYVYDLGMAEFAAFVPVGPSLPSNSVRAISARRDTVYVGTDGGLSRFYSDTVDVFTPARPGPFPRAALDRIRRIDFGVDGAVFLSTYGHGLGVREPDSAFVITREDSLLDDKVYDMVQEDDTTCYYATSMGLCAYRDSVWVNFQAGAGIPRAEIRQIEPAPDGGYYLLVAGHGVYWFDGERARRVTFRDLFAENDVAAIAVDAWGTLWACGRHGGIAAYRNGHWTEVDPDDPVHGGRRWRSAHADTTGGVFFGSADGTVLAVRDNVLNSFQLPAGLPSGRVTDIVADSSGAVYVLNGSYLLRFTDGLRNLSIEHPLPVVIDAAVSPSGVLWTATRWGLYRRYRDTYVEFTQRPPQREPVFSAIGFGTDGALWAGTENGAVHRFDGLIWMRLADAGDLGIGTAVAFWPQPSGAMWVLGADGGLARYHGGRWIAFGPAVFDGRPVVGLDVSPTGVAVAATETDVWGYDESDGWKIITFTRTGSDSTRVSVWDASRPAIRTLLFDDSGRLYVGTNDGVAVVGGEGVRWLATERGLRGETVNRLFFDSDAALWVGFRSDGLARVELAPQS